MQGSALELFMRWQNKLPAIQNSASGGWPGSQPRPHSRQGAIHQAIMTCKMQSCHSTCGCLPHHRGNPLISLRR